MKDRKHNMYIIGASSFGRVMESWLERIPENNRDWQIKGYLHTFEGESPLKNFPTAYNILGGWEDYPLTKDDFCIIAVSNCKWKEKIYYSLKDKVSFYTFVSPDVIIGKYTKLGQGSIICPGCTISTNVQIGKFVTVNSSTQLGHDVFIDDFSSVMGNSSLAGNVKIGKNVFIGVNSTIIADIVIEDDARVGAGSVVIKKVLSGTAVFGNPATIINI